MTKIIFNAITPLLLAATMFAASGCFSLPSMPSWSWSGKTSSPTKIVAIWDPVIRHEDDKVIRGFAARVMFYDSAAGKKALRVRGNFDVYAFDEDDPKADRVTPTRIIRFQVDNLKNLESDSKMFGKSYTIWVPWDEATQDSKKKNISLIVRFTCNDGTMVMSHLAKASLPGMANGEEVVEDPTYVNPYQEEKKQQMARLEAIAAKYRNNPNSLDTEWKGTVAEHVISSEKRPQEMLTTTINVPGFSRDGIPAITPQRSYASANITHEQWQYAQHLLSNAQPVQTQQGNAVLNPQVAQNRDFPVNNFPMNNSPINQVQFQSSGDNVSAYQQPTFPPASQPVFPPSPQGLAPMSQEAMVQEYYNWQQQQAAMQQQDVIQRMQQQPPLGNYAAANTGTTWR